MKKLLVLFLICLCCYTTYAAKKAKGKMVRVEGYVTQTADYCGGAQPSEEMLERLAKPNPLKGKEIVIKIGPKNKVSSPVYTRVKTDEQGKFSVMLRVGVVYSFIEEWKAKPFKVPANTQFVVWDAACLYERYLVADFVLKVNKQQKEAVNINYHVPCFFHPYCGTYSGPLPP